MDHLRAVSSGTCVSSWPTPAVLAILVDISIGGLVRISSAAPSFAGARRCITSSMDADGGGAPGGSVPSDMSVDSGDGAPVPETISHAELVARLMQAEWAAAHRMRLVHWIAALRARAGMQDGDEAGDAYAFDDAVDAAEAGLRAFDARDTGYEFPFLFGVGEAGMTEVKPLAVPLDENVGFRVHADADTFMLVLPALGQLNYVAVVPPKLAR